MPKTKSGEQITWKEFMKRWKTGIININPYQQAKMMYTNTWIIIVGLKVGIAFSFFNITQLYWLTIILIGGLGNTTVQQIANYQKLNALRRFYETQSTD